MRSAALQSSGIYGGVRRVGDTSEVPMLGSRRDGRIHRFSGVKPALMSSRTESVKAEAKRVPDMDE